METPFKVWLLSTLPPYYQQRGWTSLQVQICEIFAKVVKSVKMQTTWIFKFPPGFSGHTSPIPIYPFAQYSKSRSLFPPPHLRHRPD